MSEFPPVRTVWLGLRCAQSHGAGDLGLPFFMHSLHDGGPHHWDPVMTAPIFLPPFTMPCDLHVYKRIGRGHDGNDANGSRRGGMSDD